jgi:hypothetical protein
LISCGNSTDDKISKTYFGGKIINPSNDIVQLIGVNDKNDTIEVKLNEDNSFYLEFDEIYSNTINYIHGLEEQSVFIEPGDSIIFRLNTEEFDESLVYTGKGSDINNYLVSKFLKDEEHNISLVELYLLNQENFFKNLDSINNDYKILLEDFNYKESFSEAGIKYVENEIKYKTAGLIELYPITHSSLSKLPRKVELNESFYDYRNEITLNDSTLSDNSFYLTYTYYRIVNEAFTELFKEVDDSIYLKNKPKYQFKLINKRKKVTDSLITNLNCKKEIYFDIAYSIFDYNFSKSEINQLYTELTKIIDNSEYLDLLEERRLIYFNLNEGSDAPDFKISDGQSSENFKDYFGKPIYLCFWLRPSDAKLSSWNKDQIKAYNRLKKEYPEIQFISVYIDFEEFWQENKEESNAEGLQFIADFDEVNDKYLISSSLTFALIDKNGKLINANSRWPSSKEIKSQLDQITKL